MFRGSFIKTSKSLRGEAGVESYEDNVVTAGAGKMRRINFDASGLVFSMLWILRAERRILAAKKGGFLGLGGTSERARICNPQRTVYSPGGQDVDSAKYIAFADEHRQTRR
jgi:hypothetical protein